MSDSQPGPPIRTFKRNLQGVQDHYAQATGLLLSGAAPPERNAADVPSTGTDTSTADEVPSAAILQQRTLEVQLAQLRPAYLLPAELLNAYLDWAAVDQQWDPPEGARSSARPPDLLRRATADAYIAALILSLKAGLNLLVPILACYVKGVPSPACWGEYREHGRSIGFMAVVEHGVDQDPLLYRIDQAYRSWIVVALAPEGGHMGDDDGILSWEYTDRERLLIKGRWATPDGCEAHRYAAGLLAGLLNEWYRLINDIIMTLAVRQRLPPRVAWTLPPPEQ